VAVNSSVREELPIFPHGSIIRYAVFISLLTAGVRYRNPYQTRHTYASSLLMLGANPLYVSTQLGHVDTTLVFRTYGRWIAAGLNNDRRQRLLRLYSRTDLDAANEFPRFG